MRQGPYNPQEVLAPLMQRFGRSLSAGREEGLEQMIRAVQADLSVDEPNARRLLSSLETSGLLCFEESAPVQQEAFLTWEGKPATATEDVQRDQAILKGTWHIGPSA